MEPLTLSNASELQEDMVLSICTNRGDYYTKLKVKEIIEHTGILPQHIDAHVVLSDTHISEDYHLFFGNKTWFKMGNATVSRNEYVEEAYVVNE